MKKTLYTLIIFCFATSALIMAGSCNNPFSTRDPESGTTEGVVIKPPNSAENVLSNLEASFEGLSINDYLNVFSEDFVFHPDHEDSLVYLEDFINGWNYEKEMEFANNFMISENFKTNSDNKAIYLTPNFEFKSGQELYEYRYQMFIFLATTDSTEYERIEVEGIAWLYLRENSEGSWSIYSWVDYRLNSSSVTWGVLRARNI